MVKRVVRRTGRSPLIVRYRQATEPPTAEELSLATDKLTAPWHGQQVKLEDLPDFKARWGLVALYAEWPESERCPQIVSGGGARINAVDWVRGSA